MRRFTLAFCALVLTALGANSAPVGNVFLEACMRPLMDGTPIGRHTMLGNAEIVAPNGNYTGRFWRVGTNLKLNELKTNSKSLRGCSLSSSDARNLDVKAEGTKERAGFLWSEFSRMAELLIDEGTFQKRKTENSENTRMYAIESVEPNHKGRILAAFIFHDLASNYAFIAAAEAEEVDQ